MSELFCLTVAKKIVGEPFRVSLISGIEKIYASECYVTIFVENSLSHSTETFRRGTLLCCVSESFRWPKSLWIRGGGEYQGFPSNFFCLAVPKNAVGEPFSLSLISGIEKVWMRGWGGCQDLPSKTSYLTVPKNFVGQPFRVSLIAVIEKLYASEGYVTFFCRNFLSHSAEKLRRVTLLCCVSENFRSPKSLWIRGGRDNQEFPSKIFLSHSAENFRR